MLRSDPGRLLLLARSSLQLVLASALAADVQKRLGQRSWLVFLSDVADPDLFRTALDSVEGEPFERVVFVEPRSGDTVMGSGRSGRVVRGELLTLLNEARPGAVAVFNDRQVAGQGLLVDTARVFPSAVRLCVEDGSQAYTRRIYPRNSLWTRWRQRLRFGAGWHTVTVLGTHPLVQQFVAMYPQRLRPELRDRPVQAYPLEQFHSPSVQRLAHALCAAGGLSGHVPDDEATLFVVSHSDYARRNPGYRELIDACLALSRQPLLFKYHPREQQADYLDLARRFPGARELPRGVPVEALYVLSSASTMRVVAGMSTGLLTARLLMPRSRIVALTHETTTGDAWEPSLMAALDIQPVADTPAFVRCLDQA